MRWGDNFKRQVGLMGTRLAHVMVFEELFRNFLRNLAKINFLEKLLTSKILHLGNMELDAGEYLFKKI